MTCLLFLKMAQETGSEDQLPAGQRWADLTARSAPERLTFYKLLLIHLGSNGSALVQEIFANASSFIKKPATLSTLVEMTVSNRLKSKGRLRKMIAWLPTA